jgi:glycosyltransferase involved in cell wall biosynthesis
MNNLLFLKFPLEDKTLGGADFYALKLARFFSLRGEKVKLFTSDKKIFRLFERNGLSRRRIFLGWEPTSKTALILWPLTYFLARVKLKKILKILRPEDAFLMQGLIEKLVLTPLLMRNKKFLRPNIVWLEHKIPGKWLYKNPLRLFYRKLSKQVKIVTVSNFAKQEFLKFGVNSKNLTVIYPGVPEHAFNQKQTPFNARGEYVIGVLGRLEEEKGILKFLQILSKKLKQSPNWRILVAGDGQERKQIENFAENASLQNQISLLGAVNDLDGFFSKITVLAYPSRTPESFGMSALEAMVRGIPVIASKTGALPELLAETQKPFLIPVDEPGGWAESLEKLTENQNYVNASHYFASRARDFSDRRFFSSFMELLQKR